MYIHLSVFHIQVQYNLISYMYVYAQFNRINYICVYIHFLQRHVNIYTIRNLLRFMVPTHTRTRTHIVYYLYFRVEIRMNTGIALF